MRGPGLSLHGLKPFDVKFKLMFDLPAGKTAPRFIEDLYNFDPSHFLPDGFNVLVDLPPKYEEGRDVPPTISRDSCHHRFILKPQQCKLPPNNVLPGANEEYKIASYCASCRMHLDVWIDLRSSRPGDQACPVEEAPLHHLCNISEKSTPDQNPQVAPGDPQWTEYHIFECSAPSCPAIVTCLATPPKLTPDHVALLTNRDTITRRVQAEIDKNPDRLAELGIPEPVTVLHNLKTYLSDAKREPKKLKASNKKFLTSLGPACSPLLQYLGFTYDHDESEEEPDGVWSLPVVIQSVDEPEYDDDRTRLVDDVEKELMLLIANRPWAEQTKAKVQATFRPLPSLKEFERALGCLDYEKFLNSRRTIDLTAEEHPCYASLGARVDFHDDLLIYAYNRQRLTDEINAPYYLSCLQELSSIRNSEKLETEVAMMASAGQISSKDIDRAYQYFQIAPTQYGLEDDFIIGTFKSRVTDAPRHEAEARRHLHVIGVHRGSQVIEQVASNRISTYQQALGWLGAEESTPDDFITSLVASKLDENWGDKALANHAVSLIAEERKSAALRSWLTTGQLGDVEMDIGEAYTRLGIGDRTLEDDMILTTFQIRASETPSQAEDLRAALRSIGKEKGSQKIASFLQPEGSTEAVAPDWPVGLKNIGNTCYLNSLLQFYFTVKPLRHMLLNFNDFKMQVTPEAVRNKRVGSRKVSSKEIERAQNFAHELQSLFKSLITARESAITPEREMARLTLIKSADEETFRRQSIASSQGPPALGSIYGAPVQGPLGPPGKPMDIDEETPEQVINDDTSEDTLVGNPPSDTDRDALMSGTEDISKDSVNESNRFSNDLHLNSATKLQQRDMYEDKENSPPSKADTLLESPTLGKLEPLQEASDSRANQQTPPVQESFAEDTAMEGTLPTPPLENNSPPGRAPPVPPRPQPTVSAKPMDELEFGAQQDVTEVIGNVLFQLECAIRPTGFDKDGEQRDEIKELFYGKSKNHLRGKAASREIEEYFADIKINVADGPRDIYAALDGYFDVQTVVQEEGEFAQFGSITQLPPILQIQVQRVQYDQEKKKSYKSDAHLSLRETIYMDRYMETDNPLLIQKRQQTWEWKERLRKLQDQRNTLVQSGLDLNAPDLLKSTGDWYADLDPSLKESLGANDPHVATTLLDKSSLAQEELERIGFMIRDLESKLKTQFQEFQTLPYRLQSVFIHRGTAQFGHYWIYIFDFDRKIWRKYNDEYVTEVSDVSEVFEQDPHYPATPYFLIYVREDLKEELVSPVLRDVSSPMEDVASVAAEHEKEEQPAWQTYLSTENTDQGTRLSNPSHGQASFGWDSTSAPNPNGW
ncbi:MAG: ubiquitin-specific protease ubp2 [Chaenotheca gracillima]|nr:MAG: ubiquitin-specific protease ubp2 [Chaenotheca gracillima]